MDANKIDVDALFKQYTIKEIQAIELQVKNEIEKKKEDLRIMVYNRYRDIIEAADGIHVMKSCSKQIETGLGDLQLKCDKVFNKKENALFSNQDKIRSAEKSKRNNKYVLAVIIKVLQNSPSKIWYHLDNDEYIKAAKQYLLAQHAHICLELENNLKNLENSARHISYANELWSSIVFLSKTIASKARDTFTNLNIDSSKIFTKAMSAIYLLETSSLKEIFQEFLDKRTPMIKSVINIDSSHSNYSIKDRILKYLKSFAKTVNHIYNLFSDDPDNKVQSFEESINESTFAIESFKDDGFVITKIPSYLKNVKFKETKSIKRIKRFDRSYLQEMANLWLVRCLNDLQENFLQTFKYIKTLKNLVEIRNEVIEFEADIQMITSTKIENQETNWKHLCEVLFQKEILIWTELVSPYYYAQSRTIVENSFKTTHENLMNNLKEHLDDKTFHSSSSQKLSPEMDINSYIWLMENNQLTNFNSSIGNNKSTIDFISNKTQNKSLNNDYNNNIDHHSITPAVKQLCKSLDEELSHLLIDIESTTCFINKKKEANSVLQGNMTDVITNDFDRFSEYLETNLKKFCANLRESFIDLIQQLKNGENTGNLRIKKTLLVCRFITALSNVSCPNIKTCFNNTNQQVVKQRKNQLVRMNSEHSDAMQILNVARKKNILTEQKNIDQNWLKFIDELQGISKIGFKIWIENICDEIKEERLTDFKDSDITNQSVLAVNDIIAWDEIEIEDDIDSELTNGEETEKETDTDGQKSKLHAPLVCSPLIQTILYSLCQELTKNLSYNMIDSNLVLKDLILAVFELIINTYKSRIIKQESINEENSIKLTQNQALQMLFDLRFLYSLFDIKSLISNDKGNLNAALNKIQDEYKMVNSDLEGFIDPFDYDICTPFIQSNISKSIWRSLALYGILNTNERPNRINNTGTSMTTINDKFNLIVLSNNQHRFELLPLPSQQSQQQLSLEKQQNLLLRNQVADMKNDKKHSSSASKQLADSAVNSASAGFSNVLKWFQ